MSYWYAEFKAAFFSEWVRLGLPDPERVPRADTVRDVVLPAVVADVLDSETDRALGRGVLVDVFGFGELVGRVCGELFRLDLERTSARAEWCGRFNLGISLFDYVCDELPAAARASVLDLPVFAPLGGAGGAAPPSGAVGALLDRLASGVLADVTAELGRPPPARRAGLWAALTAMYAAEVWVATHAPARGANVAVVMDHLRSKSSEPFRVMAEWTARGGGDVACRRAAHFGRALGDCFWLVDDARDVWDDLDARRWNYFLAAAVGADSGLRLETANPVLEARLVAVWRRHDVVGTACRATLGRFARALHALGATEEAVCRASGRLVEAMAGWSR